MANTNIPLQGQTANYMLPSEALGRAYALKNQKMQSDMAAQEMTDNALMDQAYRAAGGDISKMQADPNMGFRGGMQIAKMQADRATAAAQADKEQAAADKLRLQSGIEKLNYGAQLLSGATPENWSQIRAEFGQMTGQDLGEQFDPAKVNALMQQGLSMKDKLANEWKQKGYELDVAQFGEQQRHNRTAEGISYMNAQNGAMNASGNKPQNIVWDATRGVFVDPNTRTFIAPTGEGGAPLPQKPAGKPVNMSATAQKELFEADEMVQAGENVKTAIDSALSLNDKAYSGIGATERATLRSNLPGQSPEADATVQMNNIILGQALESLKSTFGAAPTEGERKILVELQASVDKTPAQRKVILERAKELADKRIAFNRRKADSLRSGEYFSAGNDVTTQQPTTAPQSGGSNIDDLLNKYGN